MDEPPDSALLRLGRVTWRALLLEDFAAALCASLEPTDPRTERRPISRRITAAETRLQTSGDFEGRKAALEWLERARAAIERRNAVFHAVPVVAAADLTGHLLAEMPRAGRGYALRDLEGDYLDELAGTLESALSGWREVMLSVFAQQRGERGTNH